MAEETRDALQNSLDKLDRTIKNKKSDKVVSILTTWFHTWSKYLNSEPTFDPKYLIKYNAGDIITVDLGFNVGAELGGEHPAVVIEDNAKRAETVMVVPLSSLDEHETEANVHRDSVYLGELAIYNAIANKKEGTKSFAVINQMRSASKIRIKKPTTGKDLKTHLDPRLLQKIYDKVIESYTTQGLKRNIPEMPKELVPVVNSEVAASIE